MSLESVPASRLRWIFKSFNRFMVLIWRLGLGSWGNATRYGGYIMVIKHTGRKTGLIRHTPVNYAIVDDAIYCTAGFGATSDWYRNIMANSHVEIWLPDGYWAGIAEDASDDEQSTRLLREVLIASGFAGPLFGVNQKYLSDEELADLLANYRLVRITRTAMLTGKGGPGDLAWFWPLSTFTLVGYLIARGRLRKGS